MMRNMLVLCVICMLAGSDILSATVISEYKFETDNGIAVSFDQFTTSNSVIDDTVGDNDGFVHIPTDTNAYNLRYRAGYNYTTTNKHYAIYSHAQNYGSSERWVGLGQGTFDDLDSFSVDCWVNLDSVYNYKYRDEKVWHFDDENGQGTFDVHIGATAIANIPDKVEFRHKDSSGTQYLATLDWTATNNTTWVHLVAEYDMAQQQLKLTKIDAVTSL